jgi:hypothetical protein
MTISLTDTFMRRRLLIVLVTLLAATALGLLLLPRRADGIPEVRLLQAPQAPAGSYVLLEPPIARLPAGVTGLAPELWTAQFEIRAPRTIALTNGPFGVEIRDANGDCLGTGTCGGVEVSVEARSVPGGSYVYISRTNSSRGWWVAVNPELPIPPTARSVRFNVGFRRLTQQERFRMAVVKGKRQAPWWTERVARLLSRTEHWLVCQAEVQLPPFPDVGETQGGANGRQPLRSEENRTSAATASRRSP